MLMSINDLVQKEISALEAQSCIGTYHISKCRGDSNGQSKCSRPPPRRAGPSYTPVWLEFGNTSIFNFGLLIECQLGQLSAAGK